MRKKILILSIGLILVIITIVLLAFNSNSNNEKEGGEGTLGILENLESKDLLSANGLIIKRNLIKQADGSGEIVRTDDFFVIYLKPPFDRLVIEIKSSNIVGAKSEAISWLKSRGLSESDICGLPVVFQVDLESGLSPEEIRNIATIPDFCLTILEQE